MDGAVCGVVVVVLVHDTVIKYRQAMHSMIHSRFAAGEVASKAVHTSIVTLSGSGCRGRRGGGR